MKKALFGMLLFVLGLYGCTKEKEENCGSTAEKVYWIDAKAEYVDLVSGIARFKYEAEVNNVCIFENASINILVYQYPGARISSVSAYAILPNSTAPDLNMSLITNTWKGSLSLNLMQSFKKNPGSYKVRLYLFLDASSEFDAKYKYEQYVKGIDINNLVYRPG